MKKIEVLLISLLVLTLFSGCLGAESETTEEICKQVKTSAIHDKSGDCLDFDNSCLPEGWTKVANCPEKRVDLCENITCESKCEGTTYFSLGECSEGQCVYEKEEDSTECKIDDSKDDLKDDPVENNKLKLESVLRFCEYGTLSRTVDMFFSVKNIGDLPTRKGSKLAIITNIFDENTGKQIAPYKIQNAVVQKDEWFFREKTWNDLRLEESFIKGELFAVQGLKEDEFKNFNYVLVYCETEKAYQPCTEENSVVLMRGDSSACTSIKTF